MQNQNKNTFYIVSTVIIIVGIIWYFASFDYFKSESSKEPQKIQNTSVTPGTPKFIMGVVSRVEDKKIFIKIADEEKTVVVDEKTLITKQIKEGVKFVNIPANLVEIKNSSRVVVYYIEATSFSEYKAVKIQILSL